MSAKAFLTVHTRPFFANSLVGDRPESIEWTGEVEIPWKFDGDATTAKYALNVRLSSDHRWPPGFDLSIGNPEIEFVIQPAADRFFQPGFELSLRGSTILFDEPIGTFGGTATWKVSSAVDAAQKKVKEEERWLRFYESELERARNDGGDTDWAQSQMSNSQRDLKNAREELEEARKRSSTARGTAAADRELHWKLTLKSGNMSLVNLLDVIQKIGLYLRSP